MKRNYFIVALVFLTFFVISFITNILGALVPDIKATYELSYSMVAFLPFAFFIAYGVMSIPSGIFTEILKEKKVMAGAFIIIFLGSLAFAFFASYTIAIMSLFILGIGMAALQVVINPLLRIAGGEEHFAFNSVMAQLVFGLASFLSPMVYSWFVLNLEPGSGTDGALISVMSGLLHGNEPWLSMYWLFALITLAMIIIIIASRFPKVERKEDEKAGAVSLHIKLFKNPVVILFFLGIFCYVGTEQGIANWISQFLSDYHGYDAQTVGATAVSRFWGLMTVGCMLGLLLLKFIDSKKILIGFATLSIVCLTLALFGSAKISLFTFSFLGFALSIMWSVIVSLALNSVDKHHGAFSGILCTGIAGGAVIPLIVGWIADFSSLRIGMLFIYVTLGYVLSVGIWAKPIISNKTISLRKRQPDS